MMTLCTCSNCHCYCFNLKIPKFVIVNFSHNLIIDCNICHKRTFSPIPLKEFYNV